MLIKLLYLYKIHARPLDIKRSVSVLLMKSRIGVCLVTMVVTAGLAILYICGEWNPAYPRIRFWRLCLSFPNTGLLHHLQ